MTLFGIAWEQIARQGAVVFTLVTVRYLLFAGVAFLLVWVVFQKRLLHNRIQPKPPRKDKLWAEFGWSISTMAIFALVGMGIFIAKQNGLTKIYTDFGKYGAAYFVASVIGLILFHDFYFYVTHRLMHHRLLFKHVHHVHHRSTNPSPWASFSFHPTEAVIEAGIVPIAIFIAPLHPLAILAFILYMTAMNVMGHMGYELLPKNFALSPWSKWHNTAVHHNQHHEKVHCNYSLYFNWWDRLFGTMHADYEQTYREVKAGLRQGSEPRAVLPSLAEEQPLRTKGGAAKDAHEESTAVA